MLTFKDGRTPALWQRALETAQKGRTVRNRLPDGTVQTFRWAVMLEHGAHTVHAVICREKPRTGTRRCGPGSPTIARAGATANPYNATSRTSVCEAPTPPAYRSASSPRPRPRPPYVALRFRSPLTIYRNPNPEATLENHSTLKLSEKAPPFHSSGNQRSDSEPLAVTPPCFDKSERGGIS